MGRKKGRKEMKKGEGKREERKRGGRGGRRKDRVSGTPEKVHL